MRKKIGIILLAGGAAVIVFSIAFFFLSQRRDKGALQVTSTPDSKIYIDGKAIGQTPFRTNDLKDMIVSGEHTIKLIPLKGNFDSFEQKITISPRILTVVDRNFAGTGFSDASIISLSKIDDKKDAQISVVAFPQNSQVFLDSNLVGQSPILLKNVTESDHELKISREGYRDKIVRIKTVLGFRLDTLVYLGINQNVASQSSVPISSPSAATSKSVTILNTPTGFLRVREKPSVLGVEIAQVKPGEKYTLLEELDGWFEIKLQSGETGFISSEYAKKN